MSMHLQVSADRSDKKMKQALLCQPQRRLLLPPLATQQVTTPATASTAEKENQPLKPRERRLLQQRRAWEEQQAAKKKAASSPGNQQGSQATSIGPSRGPSPTRGKARPSQLGGHKSQAPDVPAKQSQPTASSQQPPQQQQQQQRPGEQQASLQLYPLLQPLPFTPVALGQLSGSHLAQIALNFADQIEQLVQAACRGQETCEVWSLDSGMPAGSSSLPQPQQVAASANMATIARDALRRLLPSKSSKQRQPRSSQTSTDGKHLSQQQLADITWAVAHLRGAHPATGLPALYEELKQAMAVPFTVLPLCFPTLKLEDFSQEVRLAQDTIYLQQEGGGVKAVQESRLTGWQSEIGATFKYSGKEMHGERLSPHVLRMRDALSHITGAVYDSVLINLYPDGRAGMRFHSDPLYGCWTPETCVVSIGATRRFVFRETSDHSSRWSFQVRNGDVVVMTGDCQDRLQHSICVEKAGAPASGPRMSLVYKQRIPGTL